MKYILLFLLILSSVFAKDMMEPSFSLKASGSVVDMLYKNDLLYVATDSSCVDIFKYKEKEPIKKIELPKITDFAGDEMESKIYSVDEIDGKILILSQDEHGYRRVDIYANDKLEHIFTQKDMLSISKAKFLDKDNIIFADLGSSLSSYNITKKSYNYTTQVSHGKFSDFCLDEQKKQIVIADESGELKIHNTKDGKFIKKLSGKNLDNVFEVDCKNSTIATAGQDRKVVIYKPLDSFIKESGFLVYSAALSPSAKLLAYSSDEQNNATLVDLVTKKTIRVLTGNKMNISKMVFINEDELVIGSDSNTINIYKEIK
ncbi:MAG: WD40 repeat domain-containing protein [Sulfurimonadaceae bacterium]|nr:WD40 repeat domain-containing protein [Sulfurimonadaceae bacterium]